MALDFFAFVTLATQC